MKATYLQLICKNRSNKATTMGPFLIQVKRDVHVVPRGHEGSVDVRLWDVGLLTEDEGWMAEAGLLEVPVHQEVHLVRWKGHLDDLWRIFSVSGKIISKFSVNSRARFSKTVHLRLCNRITGLWNPAPKLRALFWNPYKPRRTSQLT